MKKFELTDGRAGERTNARGAAGEVNYDMCDLSFMQLVDARQQLATNPDEVAFYAELTTAVATVQQQNLATATERLGGVLRAGPLPAMLEQIGARALDETPAPRDRYCSWR